jgi:hypothetical protein
VSVWSRFCRYRRPRDFGAHDSFVAFLWFSKFPARCVRSPASIPTQARAWSADGPVLLLGFLLRCRVFFPACHSHSLLFFSLFFFFYLRYPTRCLILMRRVSCRGIEPRSSPKCFKHLCHQATSRLAHSLLFDVCNRETLRFVQILRSIEAPASNFSVSALTWFPAILFFRKI